MPQPEQKSAHAALELMERTTLQPALRQPIFTRIKKDVLKFWAPVTDTDVFQLGTETIAGWSADNAPRLGAALAFYSVLSLVPLLLLVLSAATFFWGRDAAQGQMSDELVQIFGEHAAVSMKDVLTASAENTHAGLIASLIGFATLAVSASGMFGELQSAMNIIWKVKPHDRVPLIAMLKQRLTSFAMVLATGFILIASLLVSAGVAVTKSYVDEIFPAAHALLPIADFGISFSLVTMLFTLVFKVVPDRAIPWKSVWPGGALTALLFVVGKMLIGLYLAKVGVGSTYGAAGSLVVLLVWVYYSSQILFLGAEFTYVYSSHYKLHDMTEDRP